MRHQALACPIVVAVENLADNLAILIPLVTGLMVAASALIATLRGLWKKVDGVHTIVNSQRTELIDHIAVLTAALKASGIAVPPRSASVRDATHRKEEA